MSRGSDLGFLMLAAVFVAVPVAWAFPSDLPFGRTLGIALGWAGTGLLIVSLLLMVREPRLAGLLGGLERMYAWHHRLGLIGYVVLLVHPLVFAAAAWSEAPPSAWRTLVPVEENRAVWVGWIALICLMIGLAATFTTRIAYPRWRILHGLLGVGTMVGFAHLMLLGLDALVFAAAGVALLLLAWRTLRIDLGLGALPFVVTTARPVADATVEITVRPLGRELAAIVPGQFIMVALMDGPHFQGCGEYHPFTVSGVGENGELRLGIKALGDCTLAMQSAEAGTAARIQGPFGTFLTRRSTDPELWIAGGIGVTAFIAALRAAPPSVPTTLLYLYRSEAQAAYLDELRAFTASSNMLSLVEHRTGDVVPDVEPLLRGLVDPQIHQCFLCGPPGLISRARQALEQLGVAPDHIHYERFDFR